MSNHQSHSPVFSLPDPTLNYVFFVLLLWLQKETELSMLNSLIVELWDLQGWERKKPPPVHKSTSSQHDGLQWRRHPRGRYSLQILRSLCWCGWWCRCNTTWWFTVRYRDCMKDVQDTESSNKLLGAKKKNKAFPVVSCLASTNEIFTTLWLIQVLKQHK